MQKEVPEIAKELFAVVSQIKGVKSVSETVSLTYVAVVEDESCKENVEKVGSVLSSQAKKYGFELDIISATEAEIESARENAAAHLAQNTTFKA